MLSPGQLHGSQHCRKCSFLPLPFTIPDTFLARPLSTPATNDPSVHLPNKLMHLLHLPLTHLAF